MGTRATHIPNGLAKRYRVHPSNVDPEQLRMGIEVELEHTSDRRVALQIALDHLTEDPEYYTKLARMESGLCEATSGYPYLPLSVVEAFVPLARDNGVSAVARSKSGFLGAYRRAKGNPDGLSDAWHSRREGFIKRHMAQVKAKLESLWANGYPSRRALALIMWAYHPTPTKLVAWAKKHPERL